MHVFRGVEEGEQGPRGQFKGGQAHGHNSHRGENGQFDGFLYPVGLLGPVVVGDNGHHAVVQSEDRHEDKALELEVGAKHSGGGGGEGDEDSVDPEDHHRANALHDNGGEADAVDVFYRGSMKADFTGDDVNVRVALEVHNERGHRSHTLPGDRGHRGRRPHPGEGRRKDRR